MDSSESEPFGAKLAAKNISSGPLQYSDSNRVVPTERKHKELTALHYNNVLLLMLFWELFHKDSFHMFVLNVNACLFIIIV